jgi:hypothetical protein
MNLKKLAVPAMALTGVNCLAASIPVTVGAKAPGVAVGASPNIGTILSTVLSTVTGLLSSL